MTRSEFSIPLEMNEKKQKFALFCCDPLTTCLPFCVVSQYPVRLLIVVLALPKHVCKRLQVLMTRLSSIFATGMVAAQHSNFVLCMEFLEGLAAIAGVEKRPRIRHRLLGQPSVAEFKARWNLPIYFQLRQGLLTCNVLTPPPREIDRIGKTFLSHLWQRGWGRVTIDDRSCGNNARGCVVDSLAAKECQT